MTTSDTDLYTVDKFLSDFKKNIGGRGITLYPYECHDLYMILTESPEKPWYFKMNPRIKWINFNINFDELDTMPLLKKVSAYCKKQAAYKKRLTSFLMEIKPDITVTAIRREINFIKDIFLISK